MISDELLIRELSGITPVPTSHHVGLKQVLLSNEETHSNLTQIAKSKMKAGEVAASHQHPDMEECFLFLSGKGVLTIDGVDYSVVSQQFFRILAGHSHKLKAITEIEFVTIGVTI